ncbi:hypothetical protein FE784_04740 [Paenibacillus hemerocallicola]|uniref:Uncharacterized protein n=1 Tax=Paenibacillus hemerocallicola TaxID=1172614 RepID=A0A5C4TF45_9BACL|nr:hypothetical protein [Paenibacillus hemerocallicola]TNJ67276.1 hypothetical protein FE784_04740 [Paenibacillus hemerocallicola]
MPFPSFRQKIIGSLTVSILLSTAFGSILFASPPLVDPFSIRITVPPHPSQANMNTYAEIQNMNVNVIVGGNENVTKTTNEKALNLAEAHGIKILVDDWGFHWKTEMLKQATTGSGSYLRNDIRIGQTFTTPTAGTGWIMERVEFQLDGTSCPAGATVTLSVYDSPAKNQLIANASRIFTCPSETTHPELLLPRNLTMDSNASYYMEFATTSPNNVGLLKTSDADVYEGGQAYVNGVPQSTDLAFEIRFYQPERPYSDGNTQSTVLLDDLANHYQAHPALLGYSLWDEPSSALFTKLEDAAKRLHQIDPNHAVKVNLLPTYATNSQLGLDQLASDTATSIQPIGQTFQTSVTQTTISTIQLWFDSASFQGGESVTLALWDSPAKVATNLRIVGWTAERRFFFWARSYRFKAPSANMYIDRFTHTIMV